MPKSNNDWALRAGHLIADRMGPFGDTTSIEDRLAIGAYVIRIIAEREATEKAAKDKGK